MTEKTGLLKEAMIKYFSGVLAVGILVFLPAGDLSWKSGWLFMAVLFLPMFIAGIVMYVKAPDLLRSRLKAKEEQNAQKGVIRYSGLMFLAAFILAGLNHRFGWHILPRSIVITACITFLLAYLMFAEVLRENAWLSRTVEVQEGQKVVDTGLYGIVRHPMYTAVTVLFLSMPLILGCLPSFIITLLFFPIIVRRIAGEEELLREELPGYREYMQKVRYRLFPYIW